MKDLYKILVILFLCLFCQLFYQYIDAQEISLVLSKTLGSSSSNADAVAISPLGKIVAVANADRNIKIVFLETNKEIDFASSHLQTVQCMVFSPDEKVLASGSEDKSIILTDVQTGKEIKKLSGHLQAVQCLAFSPGGKMLASGSMDKTVVVWDVQNGKPYTTLSELAYTPSNLNFSFDEKILTVVGRNNTVNIWTVQNLLLSSQPQNGETYYARGNLRRLKGDLNGAISDYLQAIDANGKNAQVYYNIAIVYSLRSTTYPETSEGIASKEDDISKAIFYLDKAIQEGYNDWNHLYRNTAFASIQSDERYKKLVENKMQKGVALDDKQPKSSDIKESSRTISFTVKEKDGNLEAQAYEILFNGKKISPDEKFFPGYEYDAIVRFKEYETGRDRISIESGKDPMVLRFPLKQLKKYEFQTRESKVLMDGIEYEGLCYADNQLIEAHLIDVIKRGVFYYYTLRTTQEAQNFELRLGYRYVKTPFSLLKGVLHTENVSIKYLIEHLENLGHNSEFGYRASVLALEKLLKNRSMNIKIKYAPITEISQLVNTIENWDMSDPQDRMRVRLLVDALEEMLGHKRD